MTRLISSVLAITLITGALSLQPASFAQTTSKTEASAFIDVSADYEYSDSIQYLKKENIIQGYAIESSTGTTQQFRPDYQLNRAELVKIMVESEFDDATISSCKTVSFPDVKAKAWYAPYVCMARERGIVSGYEDGTFKPEQTVNFAEASKIITNANSILKEIDTEKTWYLPFVEAMETRKGIPPTVRSFGKNITRGEMARMVHAVEAPITDTSLSLSVLTQLDEKQDELPQIDSCNALIQKLGLDKEQPSDVYYMRGGIKTMTPMMLEEDAQSDSAQDEAAAGNASSISAEPPQAPAPESKASEPEADDDFSQTNTQVKGVDEADIIKNDGKYIYTIKGKTVRIVEAYPGANLKELTKIELDDASFNPQEIYVDDGQMVIIGQVRHQRYYSEPYLKPMAEPAPSGGVERMMMPSIWPGPIFNENRMKVYVYDISDKASPKKQRSIEIEGDYSNSRKVDKNVYFVLNQWIPQYYIQNDTSADIILPRYKDSTTGEEKLLVRCPEILTFPDSQERNYLIVAGLNIEKPDAPLSRKVLLGSPQNIFSSRENLYIAAPQYSHSIGDAPDLNQTSETHTLVYRFSLTEDVIEYQNQGKVPGNILNQFSMDEAGEYFRIATTRDRYNAQTGSVTDNNLYILDRNAMTVSGKLEGLAKGERIKSVRFMGDRGYMVTFRTTDPLFVIDLETPTSPKILGELKIPGWSDYLHPYDETHLIGFGREVAGGTEDLERITWDQLLGMKISLFDVTDVANPKEMFHEVIGSRDTQSALLSNHKALLFDREKNLLAFPITINESRATGPFNCTDSTFSSCPKGCNAICQPSSCTPDGICTDDCNGPGSCINTPPQSRTTFIGAMVYSIDLTKGFTLRGRISNYEDLSVFDTKDEWFYGDYEKNIDRVLYIRDSLYSVSQSFIRSWDLSTLAPQKTLQLEKEASEVPQPMPFDTKPMME